MLNKLYSYWRMHTQRRRWRRENGHNYTTCGNMFDRSKVRVGRYSYGNLEVYGWGSPGEGLEIGAFCSIAKGVKFYISGNKYTNHLLTYPVKTMLFKTTQSEGYSNGKIVVGDDVWIGSGAMILSGVTIGRGAVVGAGSVVAKDIPPYAVAAGNPAKIIKYRFPEAIIDRLLKIDFSNLDLESLRQLDDAQLLYAPLEESALTDIERKLTSR